VRVNRGFIIRKVDIKDVLVVETLAAMNRECFTRSEWTGHIRPTRGDWWIAFHGDKEAAFCGILPSYQTPDAGYLSCAAVLPEYRGNGLHKRMMKVRIKHAQKMGWNQLFTETIFDNAYSANTMINCGFQQFKPKTPWGSPYAVYWRRSI
jgi:N-acetylglutamate synthase-like GNAT family acetyltransferase